jgi:hypothetical protein
MFKRKEPYRNGLDDLAKAAKENSDLRALATKKLIRTLEKMKAEQDEAELGRTVQYARKSGAF